MRAAPAWTDRIWVGDAATWAPPFRFDFVHVRIELGPLDRIRGFGRRLIVSSDGSFWRPDSARLAPVEERLHELGLGVAGQIYRRSDEHQVEIAVAWVRRLAPAGDETDLCSAPARGLCSQ